MSVNQAIKDTDPGAIFLQRIETGYALYDLIGDYHPWVEVNVETSEIFSGVDGYAHKVSCQSGYWARALAQVMEAGLGDGDLSNAEIKAITDVQAQMLQDHREGHPHGARRREVAAGK